MDQAHPKPVYLDITEESIHLQDTRDAKWEDPAQSLIHQWPVKDGNDGNGHLLQEHELKVRSDGSGSDGDDGSSKKKNFLETIKDCYTNGWFTEILAVIVSCGCAAAIPIVLGVYNHDPVPKLPWDVSLNALVSVLSTVAKSSLLYAICAALGQDKWDWSYTARDILEHQGCQQQEEEQQQHQRQEQQVLGENERLETTGKSWKRSKGFDDMEMFDQASRGPLGAFKILVSRRTAFSPTSLGALVVLLSLVVDPFTQQAVRLQQRQRLVPSNDVWRAHSSAPVFCPSYDDGSGEWQECSLTLQELINGAIWLDPEAYKPQSHVHCPSGSCEWEPFHAIEYCVDHGNLKNPTGYCDISFNQTELNEGVRQYDETRQYRLKYQSCNHMFDPLITTEESYEIYDWNDTSHVQCGGGCYDFDTMWASVKESNLDGDALHWGPYTASTAVGTFTDFDTTWRVPRPLQYTKYPTNIITYLPGDRTNINGNGSSAVHIPPPLVLMAHARYDEVLKGDRSYARIGLRANMTEWSALSLCQVERKMSMVNGNFSSDIKSKKYLQPAWEDVALEEYLKDHWRGNALCWAPEDLLNDNATMARVLMTEPTGSFSKDLSPDDHSLKYQADTESTGAFCLWNATTLSNREMIYRIPALVYRKVKFTDEEGPDKNGSLLFWDDAGWEQWMIIPEKNQTYSQLGERLSRQTLPSIMSTLAIALNNQNYARTKERVTGSYVLRETILVARWEWLTVLFGIEFMGLAYLLYVILRPRPTVGVWKESIYGALYHGLDDETRSSIGHPKNLRDIKKATKYMEVRHDHLRG